MKRIAAIVLLFGLLFPTLLRSQGETSNWYFGNGAGITFNTDGSIAPQTNGKLDTFEGCATISDSFGELLFYTDGITVYNQDHIVMSNGDDLFGDSSGTQSAIIVPKPGSEDIYFVFTVDASISAEDPDNGLNYSIIDMSLNNGKGEITRKNVSLLKDCSEKVTAVVRDCFDESLWLLTFASENGNSANFNTFHAFEINQTGVVKKSIKSTFVDLNIEDPRGYLKISPNGEKLANANMKDGLFVYDFNATTGIVSNQQKVFISGNYTAPYGIEFAPNSQYLYVHASNDIFERTGNISSLLQYDITVPEISETLETLDTQNIYRGALQLGPDGKIYRTNAISYFQGTPYLSVINHPNKKGKDSNYQHKAIELNGKNSTQGLPQFIQSFFDKVNLLKNQDGATGSSLEICAGEDFTLETDVIAEGIYEWEKDGIILPNNGNILKVASTIDNDSGRYRVTITTSNPEDCPVIGEALIRVIPLPSNQIFELVQCDFDSNSTDGITLINLEQITNEFPFDFTFYANSQDLANDISISNPKIYRNTQAFSQTVFYKAVNLLGCDDSGEFTILVNASTIALNPDNTFTSCEGTFEDDVLKGTFDLDAIRRNQYPNLDVAFYAELADVALEENPIEGILNSSNTTLYVRIESANQCLGVEMISLEVQPIPTLSLETEFQVCTDGEPLIIDAPLGFNSYHWYKTDEQTIFEMGNTQQVSISNVGTYSLEVGIEHQNGNQTTSCTTITDFVVTPSNRAIFEEITITDFSEQNSIGVLVSGDGDYEYSLDGIAFQEDTLFENISPGFYTVYARDKKGCGISEEETAVVGFPKFFTPNGDGANDTWQLIGTNSDLNQGNITIYDRYGKLLKQVAVAAQGWDGTINGTPLPASDYWFRVSVEGRKQFNGHFALKR